MMLWVCCWLLGRRGLAIRALLPRGRMRWRRRRARMEGEGRTWRAGSLFILSVREMRDEAHVD